MMGIRLIFRNHILRVTSFEVTQKGKPARRWTCGLKLVGRSSRQIRKAINPEKRVRLRCKAGEVAQLRCQEKLRSQLVV